MKFKNNAVVAAAITLMLAAPLAAHADTFSFSPTGNGQNLVSVGTIDQAPGNALAVGGVTATQLAANGVVNPTFQLYYQANLNSLLAPGSTTVSAYTNGGLNQYFTFTASFTERVSSYSKSVDSTTGITTETANFRLAPVQTLDYFRIYAAAAPGNNATGTNFNTGKLIFQGTVVSEPVGNFSADTFGSTFVPLDQFTSGTNLYPSTLSVVGGGQTTLNVQVISANGDFVDLGYFPNFGNASITSNFTTNNGTPFSTVDPSRCVAATVGCITPNIGSVNGFNGPDFLLQADASQTVKFLANPTRVPEPGTTAMVGLGLALLGAFGISRKKKQA